MIETHLLSIVMLLAVAFIGGFFWGRGYEAGKRRKPKRDPISDHYALRDRLDYEWEKRHPLTPWQMEQARGMQNIYGSAVMETSVKQHALLMEELMKQHAESLYQANARQRDDLVDDDEKPN